MDVHVYFHVGQDPVSTKLDAILLALAALQKGSLMSQATIDDILAEVTRQTTIAKGAKALIEQLYAMRNDPEKLQATLDGLRGNDDLIEQAIVTNTPQAPGF
jgi:hypothetical protein